MTYFITPDMVEMKDTTLKERIDKEIAKLRKYVTTVKYLASCEESWEFCETTFRDSTEDLKLTWNEFNFAELRALDDELLLILYDVISIYAQGNNLFLV